MKLRPIPEATLSGNVGGYLSANAGTVVPFIPPVPPQLPKNDPDAEPLRYDPDEDEPESNTQESSDGPHFNSPSHHGRAVTHTRSDVDAGAYSRRWDRLKRANAMRSRLGVKIQSKLGMRRSESMDEMTEMAIPSRIPPIADWRSGMIASGSGVAFDADPYGTQKSGQHRSQRIYYYGIPRKNGDPTHIYTCQQVPDGYNVAHRKESGELVKDLGTFRSVHQAHRAVSSYHAVNAVDEMAIPGGGLGIERKDMPQIASDKMGEYTHYLRSMGASVQTHKLTVGHLKATQRELSDVSLAKMAARLDQEKPTRLSKKYGHGADKPILVSSDGYVLDGHHRWYTELQRDPNAPIAAKVISMPIRHLLDVSNKWHGTYHKDNDNRVIGGAAEDVEQVIQALREAVEYINSQRRAVVEGVFDPHILKAVFMCGGGGSGKSFWAEKLFAGTGLKVVNQDSLFELKLKGLGYTPSNKPDLDDPDVQSLRKTTAYHTYQRLGKYDPSNPQHFDTTKPGMYTEGRLGLVIDTTAANFTKVRRIKEYLEALGYDTGMVFVNVPLDVALAANGARFRTVSPEVVNADRKELQQLIPEYRQLFGGNFYELRPERRYGAPSTPGAGAAWGSDSPTSVSPDSDIRNDDLYQKAVRIAMRMFDTPLRNPIGWQWLHQQTQTMTDKHLVTHLGKPAGMTEPSTAIPDEKPINYKIEPDAYRRKHGFCPDGYNWDDSSKHCKKQSVGA